MTALWLLMMIVIPLPGIPGPVLAGLIFCNLALACWMLVRSYRPVANLGSKGWLVFLVLLALVGSVELMVSHQLIRPFKMPTRSMETTIIPGDHVFAQTCAYWFSQPKRGDIVVFKTDDLNAQGVAKGEFWTKRIAALPGERVEIKNGHLVVNGKSLDHPPILARDDFMPAGRGLFLSATNSPVLAADSFFVVGDNRENSLDSRHFGTIPRRSIIGKLTKIYWPLSRATNLR